MSSYKGSDLRHTAASVIGALLLSAVAVTSATGAVQVKDQQTASVRADA